MPESKMLKEILVNKNPFIGKPTSTPPPALHHGRQWIGQSSFNSRHKPPSPIFPDARKYNVEQNLVNYYERGFTWLVEEQVEDQGGSPRSNL